MDEWALLDAVARTYAKILGKNLVGIYVHGSIAFGCFNWDTSDIDFIVVTEEPPALEEKEALLACLLSLDKSAPPKGFEMSVVLRRHCTHFVYPTPYELHFSNAHKAACMANRAAYCQSSHGTDKDLAAHFTVIRAAGRTLLGEDRAHVFGPVPAACYADSIKGDVANAAETIGENPVYVILNLCRVLAYIKEGLVLSKKDGGAWGVKNLPPKYGAVAAEACKRYAGHAPCPLEAELLQAFAAFMLSQINAKQA